MAEMTSKRDHNELTDIERPELLKGFKKIEKMSKAQEEKGLTKEWGRVFQGCSNKFVG